MKYSKRSPLFVAVLTVGMFGCDPPDTIQPNVHCEGGVGSYGKHMQCEGGLTATWLSQVSSGFDGSKLKIETSDGNVIVVSSLASLTVVAKSNGVTLDSDVFSLVKQGTAFVLSNPSAVEDFFDDWSSQADEIEAGTSSIDVEAAAPGTSTYTNEIFYDGVLVTGDSTSWYITVDDFYRSNLEPGNN